MLDKQHRLCTFHVGEVKIRFIIILLLLVSVYIHIAANGGCFHIFHGVIQVVTVLCTQFKQ